MPSLAEFQFAVAADLLDGGLRTARLLPGDPSTVLAGLRIHRNTVLAGLANALSLTYPTVAWLTGEDFFDQAAGLFASRNPPRGACLSDYGEGFADFLENYPPAAGFSYLSDVGRFDLVIERCAQAQTAPDRLVALDGGISLALRGSLVLLTLEYPADALRDARDDDDADRLAGLDMSPHARNFAIWRGGQGVCVRSLGASSATFLGAVLRGESGEAALGLTLLHSAPEEALATIQAEIFSRAFHPHSISKPRTKSMMTMTTEYRPTHHPLALASRAIGLLNAIPYSAIALVARAATFSVFFRSGMQKLTDWNATLLLFQNEYHVPVLPPHVAAYMAASLELGGSVLVLLGLATRASVLALLGMILVIQIFIYPEAWPDHIQWVGFMFLLLARGPGAISLDALVARWVRR